MEEVIISNNGQAVKFDFGDDNYSVHPAGTLIAVADTSDIISFKLLASRKTVYAFPFVIISPSGATAAETVEALNLIL